MDFLVELLAKLFAGFKLKNPLAAAAVLLILSAITYTAMRGEFLGLFALPGWSQPVITFVSLFLTAVTGSQTYQYLNKAKAANK